jgi:purine-binding chemotaxis protein CheW
MQLVVFKIGAEEYALPIQRVQEIIRYREPRRVASGGAVRGVINLRGRIVPVCDLAHLAVASASAPEDEKIVIIEADGVAAGLMVDGVSEVLSAEDDQVDRVTTAREDVFPGIAKVADRLIVLIDPASLLADLGVAALAEAA